MMIPFVKRILCQPRAWLLALFLALLPSLALAGGSPFLVPAGETANGVATVTQSVVVDGDVVGDVTSWSGNITINGHVGGDVVTYTGNVRMTELAKVDGSVMSMAGVVQKHSQAAVGRTAFVASSGNAAVSNVLGVFLPPSATPDSADVRFGRGLLGGLAGLFLFAFALLWGALWPNRTLAGSLTLADQPTATLVVGLLATSVMVLIVPPLVSLLTASMIGMPLLVVLFAIIHLPYVFGLAILGRTATLQMTNKPVPIATPAGVTIAVVAAVAILVASVAAWSPVVGLGSFYLIVSPGLGAVLLSRGGLLAPRVAR